MRFIGDVHANFDKYLKIIRPSSESIQVGDFGAGFEPLPNPNINHRFIRGNHDSPEICRKAPNWIKDGSVEILNNKKLFFLGGALSIDQYRRVEGISWWEDEQLPYQELNNLVEKCLDEKPQIIITHDAPDSITKKFFPNQTKLEFPSRTSQALEIIFQSHQPNLWIFGHWHQSRNETINKTRFICLAELEFLDLEI